MKKRNERGEGGEGEEWERELYESSKATKLHGLEITSRQRR